MQFLQTVSCTRRGGIQQVSEAYAAGFSQAGLGIRTFADIPDTLHPGYAHAGSHLVIDRAINSPWRRINPIAISRFRRLIRAENISACIVHNGHSIDFLRSAAPSGVPIVTVCHMEKIGSRLRGDIILCLTKKQRDLVMRTLGDQQAHKTVLAVGNPLVLPQINDLGPRSARILASQPYVIGTLGHLRNNKKGVDILIRALPIVRAAGFDVRVRVAGQGDDLERLQSTAREFGVADAVEFVGFIIDRDEYFSTLDVFCMPSRIEPFGLALIEAMSRGLPSCASDTEGPAEIISTPQLGWLFKNGDANHLAKQLIDIISDPQRARTIGVAGGKHVAKVFAGDVVAAQIRDAVIAHAAYRGPQRAVSRASLMTE